MRVEKDQSLAKLAYFATGGRSRYQYFPTNFLECREAICEIRSLGLSYFLLGAGSNSLVSDDDYEGAVLSFAEMTYLYASSDHTYVAGAGVNNRSFVEFAHKHSSQGASWMFGLPGQIGATTRMNARCYGGEISQIVQEVKFVDESGNAKVLGGGDQVFRGYKDTVFMQHPDWVIGEVKIKLEPGDPQQILKDMHSCYEDREKKGQFKYPSCGCVFKNDYSVGVPSGLLLEKAGAKSLTVGKAFVSPYHANFVFHQGAKADDILQLTLNMREKVYDLFGVWLEYEMELLGTFSQQLISRVTELRPQKPQEHLLEPLRAAFKKKA